MKSYIVHLSVIMILFGLFSLSFGADADQSMPGINLRAVESNEDAYKLALKYTGFEQSKDFKRPERVGDICQIITTKDTTTAFLSDEISNRTAWQVKLANISMHLKGNTPEGIILGPLDFTILIDSLTGIPLRISSTPKEPIEREATSMEAESQLHGERYTGIPSQLPIYTVFEILNECKFYPAISKVIIVNYVMYSKDDSSPRPVWLIYLRGLPPMHSGLSKEYEYVASNRRYIFDAITGDYIWCDNKPYPILSNDK